MERKRGPEEEPSMEGTVAHILANQGEAITKENFVQVMTLLVQLEKVGALSISALSVAYGFLTKGREFKGWSDAKWKAYFNKYLLPRLPEWQHDPDGHPYPQRVYDIEWDVRTKIASPFQVFIGFLFEWLQPQIVVLRKMNWEIYLRKTGNGYSYFFSMFADNKLLSLSDARRLMNPDLNRINITTSSGPFYVDIRTIGEPIAYLLAAGWRIQEKPGGFHSQFPKDVQTELIGPRFGPRRWGHRRRGLTPGRIFRRGLFPLWRGLSLAAWTLRGGLWYPWWYWLPPDYYQYRRPVAVTYADGSIRYLVPPYPPGSWGNYAPPPGGWREQPMMYAGAPMCDQCEVEPAAIECGAGCETAYYCGEECAKRHEEEHKKVCNVGEEEEGGDL